MYNSNKELVLYGCGQETEKFILKHRNANIAWCIDDKLAGKNFCNYNVYKLEDKKNELNGKLILIFVNNPTVYTVIARNLKKLGRVEFEDFIPYNIYKKKIALTWGNCHVEYIRLFLSYSREFSEEYAFYPKKNLWDMKPEELDRNLFEHCDLLVCQHIRQENSLSSSFSSDNVEGMLKKDCKIIKFPNMFGLPVFLFPQTDLKDFYKNAIGNIKWYRDKVIDRCIANNITDPEKIYSAMCEEEFKDINILEKYMEFSRKLIDREKQCNIHIFDYISEHLADQKLFIDIEHPSKKLLGEIANRILEYLDYNRLDSELVIGNSYGHETLIYPHVKRCFNMVWKENDLKKDNAVEKMFPVYMDELEYIRQYCLVYLKENPEENCEKESSVEESCAEKIASGILAYYMLKVEGENNITEWKSPVYNGEVAGMDGQGKACYALKCWLDCPTLNLRIQYRAYLSKIGWTEWTSGDDVCGSELNDNYVQAIQMKLTGQDADKYSVKYSVSCQNIGWMKFAKDSEVAGVVDDETRLEAIKVEIYER